MAVNYLSLRICNPQVLNIGFVIRKFCFALSHLRCSLDFGEHSHQGFTPLPGLCHLFEVRQCFFASDFNLHSRLYKIEVYYIRSNCPGFNPLYSNPNFINAIFFFSISELDLLVGNDVATTRARFTTFV